jgi:molecular chaperone GrpE
VADPFQHDEIASAESAVSEATPGGGPADTDLSADAASAAKTERDALQDRLLRLAAEFDNYRKRVDRDRREQADAATAAALEDLLPIVDDLERALGASTDTDAAGYRKGVELIHRQMTDLLRKRGVTTIEAVGTDFDPHIHQAVMREVSETHRDGEVMAELRRGYRLGDRLLRPAVVKVAKRE